MLFPYHLSRYVIRELRITPFQFYSQMVQVLYDHRVGHRNGWLIDWTVFSQSIVRSIDWSIDWLIGSLFGVCVAEFVCHGAVLRSAAKFHGRGLCYGCWASEGINTLRRWTRRGRKSFSASVAGNRPWTWCPQFPWTTWPLSPGGSSRLVIFFKMT